ncbi:MAG: glycosyltransferase [Chitinophagales bacterium]|nr:glycosyltransferase [Chitinophagales bacterium]
MIRSVILFTGSLHAGGLERFVTRVAVGAAKSNAFYPIIVCLEKKEGIFLRELEQSGITVLEAPHGWQRSVWSLLRLRRMIKDLHPAVVHSQVNFSLLQQWLACRRTGAHFMVTERNMYPLKGWDRIRRIFQFYLLFLAGVKYSANSADVAEHLSKLLYFPSRKIKVIPNGITLPEINSDFRIESRQKLGFNERDFVVGYVARFAAQKGHLFFLQVMGILRNYLDSQIKVCFVGNGPLRERVEQEVHQLRLSDCVSFTGTVSDLSHYYSAFDCLALLSKYEGMPNVVLEAMSYALPVVANPAGNTEELLMDDCGMINRSEDPEETAQLFLKLAKNPALREYYGQRARQKVGSQYSMDRILTLLCNEYEFLKN